ncbi:MAG: L-serine ammonia-lyase [Pirellula sp.]
MISIFDLFKVGVGPSSSHTVGPMIAAYRFAQGCFDSNAICDNEIHRVQVELYGSLALTGAGHATDVAILAGLSGCLPDRTQPAVIQSTASKIRETKRLRLADQREINFDPRKDFIWRFQETLPQHPNAMQFSAFGRDGQKLIEEQYFSTGGGFVYSSSELKSHVQGLHVQEMGTNVSNQGSGAERFPFASAKELLAICRREQCSIEELIHQNELSRRSDQEISDRLNLLWDVMSASIESGCKASGILPGALKVPRRAPKIFCKLAGKSANDFEQIEDLPPARPSTPMLFQSTRNTSSDPLQQIDWVSLFALAVNEENAAGGRVVTAPTNGAAGIIPAVLAYYVYFYPGANQAGVYRFLKTAGAIGLLYKRNASLSAAEMGCQGEVGVACSMAAAGLAACMNGTVEQIENAAEIGMEHNLGLTCDPIGGLVQVPCIERNTMGATKAINAARLAVLYGDGKHFVSLDRVIETMRQTGVDMQVKYKETSLGGLAVNVVDC